MRNRQDQSMAPHLRHEPSRIRREHSRWKFHYWHIHPPPMARTLQNRAAAAAKQNQSLRRFEAKNKKFRA